MTEPERLIQPMSALDLSCCVCRWVAGADIANDECEDGRHAVCGHHDWAGDKATESECKPQAHRYDRVGLTDLLRCRRCGKERYG